MYICVVTLKKHHNVTKLSSTNKKIIRKTQIEDYEFHKNPLFLQWVPEITHHCPRTPFLLVGTQVDLREDATTVEKLAKNRQRPIVQDMGEKQAKELKAVKYVECSALTQVG